MIDPDLNESGLPRISRLNAVRALRAGRDARLAGQSNSACPFNLNGTLGEQFNGLWWIRGWRRAGENDDPVIPDVDDAGASVD